MLTCFLLEDIASICWRLWRHVRRSIPLFHVLPPYGGFEFFQCQNLIWGLGHLCLAMKSPLAVDLQHLTTSYNILQHLTTRYCTTSSCFLLLPITSTYTYSQLHPLFGVSGFEWVVDLGFRMLYVFCSTSTVWGSMNQRNIWTPPVSLTVQPCPAQLQ